MSGKILIAEDSSTTRKMLAHVLTEHDYEVVMAETGSQALERISRESFDLLLTDVNMPEMNGVELVRQVRDNPSLSELPIIILSTETDPEDRRLGYDAGANLYLGKPISPKQLIYKVQSLLSEAA